MPSSMFCVVEAMISIEERAGPTHGVQPTENVIPTMKDPRRPTGFSFKWMIFS